MNNGNKRVRQNMLWYQNNFKVGLIYLFMGIVGGELTRMLEIGDFPGSRVSCGGNNLR